MNQFIAFTDKGGFFGSFYWRNSGVNSSMPYWGEFFILPRNITGRAWAGSLWVIRYVLNNS